MPVNCTIPVSIQTGKSFPAFAVSGLMTFTVRLSSLKQPVTVSVYSYVITYRPVPKEVKTPPLVTPLPVH